MDLAMMAKIIVLQIIVFGVLIFFLHKFLVSGTQNSMKRLDVAVEDNRAKQAELNRKIKEADEELAKRKKEADDLTKKMIAEAEEKAKEERDKMTKKAREEGEEIIAKAQSTKDKMRLEIEKETSLKFIDFSTSVLSVILSEKAKGALDKQLIAEFLDGLEKVDMAQVSSEIDAADVITAAPIDSGTQERFAKVIKGKLNRAIKVQPSVDPSIIGGVVLKFGSLAIDGSLQNIIRESGVKLKQKAEEG